jgi:small neutral amino acid transporter SnatA (MarC family)
MLMTIAELAATALATLVVAFGPVETAAVFGALIAGVHRPERFRLARKAVLIGGGVLLVFALAGLNVLATLHISLDAFRVAGGILLLIQARDLIFADRSGQAREDRVARELIEAITGGGAMPCRQISFTPCGPATGLTRGHGRRGP